MIKAFGVSKSINIFKMSIVTLSVIYRKVKKSTISLNFIKNFFEPIKKIYKENDSEFK